MKNAIKSMFYWSKIIIGLTIACIIMSFTFLTEESWKEITMKDYDKIMEKAATHFEGKTAFSVDVKMSSFKTHTDKTPYETQTGFFIRSGNNYHQFMLGMHTYQNKAYKFVIDSTEKNIMVAAPANEKDDEIFFDQYKAFKTQIKKIEKISGKEIDKLKVSFIDKSKLLYMEIELDKNCMVKKSTSFFRVRIAEDPTDENSPKSTPRIETIFTNYKSGIKVDYNRDFSEAPYFILVNGKLKGVNDFKNYYIKDTRVKTTK